MRCRFGFRVLAITIPAILGLTSSLLATTIYDDFDSASLDAGLWSVQNYGGSASQASSEVTVHSNAGGFYQIDSTSGWGQGNVFTITIGTTAPTGTNAIGLYCGAGGSFSVRNDSGSWYFDVNGGTADSLVAVNAPAANNVLEFTWNSNSVTYKNGSEVVTETTQLPTGVAHFFLANWDGPANLNVASVAVGPVPEPSTVAFALSGLLGLLCYAWRKRK